LFRGFGITVSGFDFGVTVGTEQRRAFVINFNRVDSPSVCFVVEMYLGFFVDTLRTNYFAVVR
jgi:hypothetical protein